MTTFYGPQHIDTPFRRLLSLMQLPPLMYLDDEMPITIEVNGKPEYYYGEKEQASPNARRIFTCHPFTWSRAPKELHEYFMPREGKIPK